MKLQRLDSIQITRRLPALSRQLHQVLHVLLITSLLGANPLLAAESPLPADKSSSGDPATETTSPTGVSTSSFSAPTGDAGGPNPLGDSRTVGAAKARKGGAAGYSVSVVVPPGTNGVAPSLSFVYNSQSQENEILGLHWKLKGLPTIERCPRTITQDTVGGGVNYDFNDRFCMDGARLMLITSGGTYGMPNTEYRTEVDQFVKIIAYGTSGNGPSYFKLWTKSGEVMEFGNTEDSRIQAVGKASVRVWALNRAQDFSGNYFTVSYTEDNDGNGDYRPNRIDYTGNDNPGGQGTTRSVQFFYETRTDINPTYIGGSVFRIMKRLVNLKTYVGTTLVKDYRLTYEYGTATARSRLTSITECAADGSCLPGNTFGWQEGGLGFVTPIPSWGHQFHGTAAWNIPGDFNGDGKADILSRGSTNTTAKLHLSTGTGFDIQTWTSALRTQNVAWNFFGDFNGDGKTDVASYAGSLNNLKVHLSTGSGFDIQTWTLSLPLNGNSAGLNYVGDFNGDGRADILSRVNASTVTVHLSTGSGFTSQTWSGCNLNNSAPWNYIGDFNGDGKADLMRAVGGSRVEISLSTGAGCATPTFWTVDIPIFNDQVNNDPGLVYLGDFNGDGKTDLLHKRENQSDARVHLSTGNDFVIESWPGQFCNTPANTCRVADVNGDGKSDLVRLAPNTNPYMNLSTGTGFTTVQWPGSLNSNDDWSYIGDFDGDGKADVVSRMTTTSANVHRVNFPFPDLITTINNGFGGTSTLTYKPITDGTVYAKDTDPQFIAQYPNMDVQNATYVVSNMSVSDGLGSTYPYTYTYGGAKFNHHGRGWLRFRWTRTIDSSANSDTTIFYNQTFPLIGLPQITEVASTPPQCFAPNDLVLETVQEYITPDSYPGTGVKQALQSVVHKYEWECQSTNRYTRTNLFYDAFGNPTQTDHLGVTTLTGDERTEQTEWVIDLPNWQHRPKRQALYDVNGVVREKWLYYDGLAYDLLGTKGLLTKVENRLNTSTNRGDSLNPFSTFGYDPVFGVKTSETDARNCTTTTAYESTKTFPESVAVCVESLNFVTTFIHDARFGVVTSKIDPYNPGDNPLPFTNFDFDLFGRLTKVTGALDTGSFYGTMTINYLGLGNPSQQRVQKIRTTEHGTATFIWSEEFIDGLGRVDQTRQQGPGGSVIQSESLYDSRGMVINRTAPHFDTQSPLPPTVFMYDALGRPRSVTHPDGRSATKYHNPGIVTTTDERGKVKHNYLDAYGQLIQLIEINGPEFYVTQYTYDGAGSLKTVVNALNHTTQITYDTMGWKRTMQDPNMGLFTYDYFPGGDLKTQTDARNQTLEFTYDALGRVLTKKQGTTTLATFTYDALTVPFSKTRLTGVVDPTTTTSLTQYDAVGRLKQTQRTLMGVPHTLTQDYDALSRLKSEIFSDDPANPIQYTYDGPWLNSVSGYINAISYNARGQKLTVDYFNGVRTTWNYFDQSGDSLKNFKVKNRTSGPSNSLQHLEYTYDNVGNVLTITDNKWSGSRTFQYDDLSRLTNASGAFTGSPCIYVYNAIGNITNKCGTTYTYDPLHPSAVASISPIGSPTKFYSYDPNGNMITSGPTGSQKILGWDVDNRVSSINVPGGGTTIMEYDYAGNRVKKNAPAGITLYPFKGWEIDPSGTVTKFIIIGTEMLASKKGNDKFFYHNDHLGGINVISNFSGLREELIEYDPWGTVSKSEGPTPGSSPTIDLTHRFTGQELDPETGLYYYGARYYDSELSRFISPDDIVANPGNAQSLNRYSYVLNNPQYYIDPTGNAEASPDGDPENGVCDDQGECAAFLSLTKFAVRPPSEGGYADSLLFGGSSPEYYGGGLTRTAASRSSLTDFLDRLQFGLGIFGMAPGLGVVPDLANAGISLARGNLADAGWSLAAAVPIVGDFAAIPNIASKAAKIVRNPFGRTGDLITQQTVKNVIRDLDLRGFKEIRKEVFFEKGASGIKNRFSDVVGVNPQTGEALIVNIGLKNKNGTIIARERRALKDIENSTTIKNKYPNSRVEFVEKGAGGLAP